MCDDCPYYVDIMGEFHPPILGDGNMHQTGQMPFATLSNAMRKMADDQRSSLGLGSLPFSAPRRTYATLAAAYVIGDLVPEWQAEFERRNAEYGEYDSELGQLGETVEIIRKAKKLRRAFIDKVDTSGWDETPREVALDLIGHVFLLIMLMDENGAGDE